MGVRVMSREGLREQQRTVAVAEETETVREGVIVEASPLFADECRYQQQQRAFWLVKIGYHTRSQPVGETGHYHNLRGGLPLDEAPRHPVYCRLTFPQRSIRPCTFFLFFSIPT